MPFSLSGLFGGGNTGATKELERLANANFTDFRLQKFLPPSLRFGQTGETLRSGIQGIGELIRNPGQLSGSVSDAIRPRLAAESERIAGDARGIKAQAAGAGARSNSPISIKNALSSALDVAQSRAQRGARREALTDSDRLRRDDLSQTFKILQAIMGFLNSGRGQASQNLGVVSDVQQRSAASDLAFIGSLGSSIGTAKSGDRTTKG